MKLHRGELSAAERRAELNRVLEAVGLVPAADTRRRFPYELSGGQRQRVGFAQALALRPKLIVADEPVSMLDVSIRVGVLNLMGELREREGVSFLYITHDVASARYLADRVLVMYAGHLVEEGATEDVLQRPKHPVHAAARLGRARSSRRAAASPMRATSASRRRSSTRSRAAASGRAARSRSRSARR